MASRRMIASDIWRDEFISELDIFGRLLWIGLITTCADDQGRLPFKPRLIRSDVFPLDDISPDAVESELQRFATAGRILIYQVEGREFIQILSWWKYQTPSWAAASKWPPPAGWVDRVKVHQGSRVVTIAWDKPGGFPHEQEVPKALPTDLPNDHPIDLNECDVKDEGKVSIGESEPPPPPPPRPNIFGVYEAEIGPLTPMIGEELEAAVKDYTEPWVEDAIREAVTYGARSWAYCRSILQARKAGRTKPRKAAGGYSPAGGGVLTPEQQARGTKPELSAAQLVEWERAKLERKNLLERGGGDGTNQ